MNLEQIDGVADPPYKVGGVEASRPLFVHVNDGLRTIRKLAQWNPDSLLAQIHEGDMPPCPFCGDSCADSIT